ncbi:MAG TPA: outer membrane protein transport protein [Burkholderiales bacterium]
MGSRSQRNRMPGLVAIVALTATATWAGSAHAAGFALMEQNASGLGNAYAGQAAAAEDASTIFFNPAGMTYLPGRQVVVGGNFIRPKTEFNDSGSTVPAGFPPGGDGGDAGDLSFVPHGYLSWEVVPSTVWLGVGVGVPFGLKTDYDDNWVGRFHGTHSEVKTININPSIAWKANEMVSFGFGINLQKFDAELANGVAAHPAFSTEATVEGDDWGWGWNAGIMLNFRPTTRVGISYRSTIKYDLDGDVDFDNVPPPAAALLFNGGIKADVKVPDTLSVGLAHQLTPQLQLLADYTWTGWDTIQDITIKRDTGATLDRLELDMHNTWRAGVGMNYQLNDAWKLRAGVAYDRSAIRHSRTPRLPDEDRLWFAVGAQWAVSKEAAIDIGYAYLTTRGDASINLTKATPAGNANLRGDYDDAKVHIVGVQARYSF